MKYTILATYVTTTTLVEYEYNGVTYQVSIPHFNTQTQEEINLGIENRIQSEINNLQIEE